MTHVKLNRKAIEEVTSIQDLEERKKAIFRKAGNLHDIEVMYNGVLIGTYVRPNRTVGGIILTSNSLEEDVWQGKTGVVLKIGKDGFRDDETFTFNGQKAEVGDWVVFKVGDAWQLTVGDWPCRLVRDSSIRMKVKDPAIIDKD